jgi:hypothetical protein
MYKIIGGDGNEYGPVTAEQLRQWIAEGRVSDQTKAQIEGSTDWRPLSTFPEFTEALGSVRRSVPPQVAPPVPSFPRPMAVPAMTPRPAPAVPNYLIWSILVTIFCSPIFGIVAIVYAVRANSKQSAGEIPPAMEASRKAKMWCWIAFVVGIITIIVGIVAICVFAVRGVQKAFQNIPQNFAQLENCLGETLAEETAKVLDNQGEVVAITLMGGQPGNVPDAPLGAFKTGLTHHAEITLVAVEGPNQQEMMSTFEGIPPTLMNRVVSNHPNAKAIVSFIGVPSLEKAGEKVDTNQLPRIVALNKNVFMQKQWKTQLRNGVVSVVIVPRFDGQWGKLQQTNDCASLVKSRYVIVTKENAEEVTRKMKPFYPTDEK